MTRSSVILNARKSFFDSEMVLRAVDQGKAQAFAKIGADVRYEARGSMRRRKGAAAPGKPPHVHKGQLKRLLFFSYDPALKSVVIGPVAFGAAEAPAALEFGGRVKVRRRRGRDGKAEIEARPYMLPALERSKNKIPDAFKGIL